MPPRTTFPELMLEEFLDWSHAKLGVDSKILLSYYEAAKAELSIPGSANCCLARTVIEWYERVIWA